MAIFCQICLENATTVTGIQCKYRSRFFSINVNKSRCQVKTMNRKQKAFYLRCRHWSVWLVGCYLSHLLPHHALILERKIASQPTPKSQYPQ